jgi:hypothetical protein
MLSSRHSVRSPLLWFDEDSGQNKALRYARNQKSPFEEEQDGNAVLEPVIFEDGMLIVEKQNQSLQQFLHYHPGNGRLFTEVNYAKDAAKELEYVEKALDAQIQAKDLSLEHLLMVCRVLMGSRVDSMSTAELKRDILIYAKNEPQEFMGVLNDPMLKLQDLVYQFFAANLLSWRNGNKDVYFNLTKNKQKMLTVPYGEDGTYIVASYFQSDDGIETLKMLKSLLNKDKK